VAGAGEALALVDETVTALRDLLGADAAPAAPAL
jgi:hypothetical protein